MSEALRLFRPVVDWWQSARARVRLVMGALLVAAIGLLGLTPNVLFDVALSWPYAALIAAIGWGRSGLGFAPMAVLVVFGFAQDVTASAPLGCFALVNLIAYGASAGLSQTFDIERSQGMNYGLPVAILFLGMVMVWLLASFSSSHLARLVPLMSAFLATLFLHMLIAPVFDLGIRRGASGSGVGV